MQAFNWLNRGGLSNCIPKILNSNMASNELVWNENLSKILSSFNLFAKGLKIKL